MSSIFKLLAAMQKKQIDQKNLPLTLTAQEAGSTVVLNKTGSPNVDGIQYKTKQSGGWQSYTIGTTITLSNVGDYVQFQDLHPGNLTGSYRREFSMTGKIAATRKHYFYE